MGDIGNPAKRQIRKKSISFVYSFGKFSNMKRSRKRRKKKKLILKSGENQQSLSVTASEEVFIHAPAFHHSSPSTQPSQH